MTDRKLVEKAAKAAGLEIVRWQQVHAYPENPVVKHPRWQVGQSMELPGVHVPWDPLHDHGDALRLAVRLRMTIQPAASVAATCRAIVRSAAAMA